MNGVDTRPGALHQTVNSTPAFPGTDHSLDSVVANAPTFYLNCQRAQERPVREHREDQSQKEAAIRGGSRARRAIYTSGDTREWNTAQGRPKERLVAMSTG